MSVSIIIPSCNDNEALAELLMQICNWKKQPYEIIVVDSENDKNCVALCKNFNARHTSFKKNRGAQQKYGATQATGETLWFLHADVNPHVDSLSYIEKAVNDNSNGGFFRFEFSPTVNSLTASTLTWFTNWRSRHFTAYGDQGIFVKREFYETVGGHGDQCLFEEVQLIKALRNSKKLSISNLPIGVSTRRWESDGYWTRTIRNRFLAIAYSFGISADKLSKWYPSNKAQLQDS